MKTQRMFAVLLEVLRKGRCTCAALAEKLEVSERTIRRDVDALCEAGVPLCTSSGKGGGIFLAEGYSLGRAYLTDSERPAAAALIAACEGSPDPSARSLAVKLAVMLSAKEQDWLKVELRPFMGDSADATFATVSEAARANRLLSMVYKSPGGESRRTVQPITLFFRGAYWYLFAYCLLREDYRLFRLSRIQECEALCETFERPPVTLEMWESQNAQSTAYSEIRLLAHPSCLARLEDYVDPRCITQAEGGWLDVLIRWPLDGWVVGFVLSLGGSALVISPPELVQAVRLHAEGLSRMYLDGEPAMKAK